MESHGVPLQCQSAPARLWSCHFCRATVSSDLGELPGAGMDVGQPMGNPWATHGRPLGNPCKSCSLLCHLLGDRSISFVTSEHSWHLMALHASYHQSITSLSPVYHLGSWLGEVFEARTKGTATRLRRNASKGASVRLVKAHKHHQVKVVQWFPNPPCYGFV